MPVLRTLCCALLLLPVAAFAQSAGSTAPQAGAVPQDGTPQGGTSAAGDASRNLEPAVDTSRDLKSAASNPPAGGDLQPQAAASPTADSSSAAPAPARNGRAAARRAGGPEQTDRVDLGTTDITGNKELPTVTYIVPWKRSDLTDLTGKPVNSLVDETLAPVDRTVFNRQNRYYDALARKDTAGAGGAGAQASPGQQGPGARDER